MKNLLLVLLVLALSGVSVSAETTMYKCRVTKMVIVQNGYGQKKSVGGPWCKTEAKARKLAKEMALGAGTYWKIVACKCEKKVWK